MTGDEMRAVRKITGLSADKFGRKLINLDGEHVSETVHRWESEEREPSGPVQALYERIAREHNLALIEGKWQRTE